ncbi:transporter substrate-binding domain-containing protein, partial [Pseudomonadota bacterium]
MNAWPPFNFVNTHGTPTGIGADYIAALNQRLGGVLKPKPGAWNKIYDNVKNKRIDALMDITPKPERKSDFNFTRTYLNVPHVIVARKDTPNIANEHGLQGKVLALEQGFGNVNYFRQNYPQIKIKEFSNTRLALDAVARGEAHAYAGNRSVALYIISQELMTTLKVHGRLMKDGSALAIGVRKDWELFTALLDRALADVSQEEISQIHNRWVGEGNSAKLIKLTTDEQLWLKTHPTIRIAFDENYAPYSYKNEDGEFVGIAVDIAKRLAVEVGLKLEIYPHGEWKQLYSAAQTGEVDVIATLVKRPNRESWFEFTRPYISLSQYVITRSENRSSIDRIESLSGKRVALIEGYSTTELLLENLNEIEPYYVANLQEALEAVSIGIADATVGDIGMSNHLITKTGLSNLVFTSVYTKNNAKQRLGVRKDWPMLAAILDKALESLSYSELMNIYARWRMPELAKPEAGFLSVIGELTDKEKVWLDEHPVIRLASDFAWPPFETVSEEGQYTGMAADYIDLIEKRLGIKFVISPRKPWSEIIEMVKNKRFEGGLGYIALFGVVFCIDRSE